MNSVFHDYSVSFYLSLNYFPLIQVLFNLTHSFYQVIIKDYNKVCFPCHLLLYLILTIVLLPLLCLDVLPRLIMSVTIKYSRVKRSF
uniref:Uncharacterized protein n=1 Tax=Octopus bimaculoides TaxID=37653 RepID=A0A0L8I2C2_OCTBM